MSFAGLVLHSRSSCSDSVDLRAGLCKRLTPVSSASSREGAALNHGAHVAMSMALGFLFMGGGARTFSTRDEAVAALVIALYPRFPRSTADNRYHHQVGDPFSFLAHLLRFIWYSILTLRP